MAGGDGFICGLVYLIIFGVLGSHLAHGDEASDFVTSKEEDVRNISRQAEISEVKKCDLVNSCICSRRECQPLKIEKDEVLCATVSNNSFCQKKAGQNCNSVLANFKRGYARLPPLNLLLSGTPEVILGETICTLQALDSTFIQITQNVTSVPRNSTATTEFYNLYFGAVDGVFRFYPGRESHSCNAYDPRTRPWYTGAISVVKDLVILLDTGVSMRKEETAPTGNYTTPFDVAKNMTQRFLQTLTLGDRASVVAFNDTPMPDLNYTVGQGDEPILLQSEPFNSFLQSVNNITVDGDEPGNSSPSNFSAAFESALSIFNDNMATPNSLKIVILLTDGQYPPDDDAMSRAATLNQTGGRLFVYEIGSGQDGDNSSWGALACRIGGYNARLADILSVVINPLAYLSSYFSFLARSRLAANDSPFWQIAYPSASGLGMVMTVAYPAMSSDGQRLIGVAGIDVPVNDLSKNLLYKISLLLSPTKVDISTNPNGVAISESQCQMVLQNDGDCGDVNGAVCRQDYDAPLKSLVCCGKCAVGSHKTTTSIILGVSGSMVFLVALLVLFFVKKRCKSKKGRHEVPYEYRYEELYDATHGFDESYVIGRGAFGVVYRAVLSNGDVAAVKHFARAADNAEDFKAEMRAHNITKRHPNLVLLKGACFRPTECYLVYEFVSGGDLYSWLWPEEQCEVGNRFVLGWNQRLEIARGTARGLNYLHKCLRPGAIFHLDIKPRNILLDEHCSPKIGDFGISQLYEPGYTLKTVRAGTRGYMAPEVFGGAKPTSRADVYSFGVVLLQLVSGLKLDDPRAMPSLLPWAKDNWNDGFPDRIVDERLIQAAQDDSIDALMNNLTILIELALRCLSESPQSRPDMSEVLDTIDSLETVDHRETPVSVDQRNRPPGISSFLSIE